MYIKCQLDYACAFNLRYFSSVMKFESTNIYITVFARLTISHSLNSSGRTTVRKRNTPGVCIILLVTYSGVYAHTFTITWMLVFSKLKSVI